MFSYTEVFDEYDTLIFPLPIPENNWPKITPVIDIFYKYKGIMVWIDI